MHTRLTGGSSIGRNFCQPPCSAVAIATTDGRCYSRHLYPLVLVLADLDGPTATACARGEGGRWSSSAHIMHSVLLACGDAREFCQVSGGYMYGVVRGGAQSTKAGGFLLGVRG